MAGRFYTFTSGLFHWHWDNNCKQSKIDEIASMEYGHNMYFV